MKFVAPFLAKYGIGMELFRTNSARASMSLKGYFLYAVGTCKMLTKFCFQYMIKKIRKNNFLGDDKNVRRKKNR